MQETGKPVKDLKCLPSLDEKMTLVREEDSARDWYGDMEDSAY